MVSCVLRRLEVIHVEDLHAVALLVLTAFLIIRVTPEHGTGLLLFVLLLGDGILDRLGAYPYARLVLHLHGNGLLVVRDHDAGVGRIFGFLRLFGWRLAVHVSVVSSTSRN